MSKILPVELCQFIFSFLFIEDLHVFLLADELWTLTFLTKSFLRSMILKDFRNGFDNDVRYLLWFEHFFTFFGRFNNPDMVDLNGLCYLHGIHPSYFDFFSNLLGLNPSFDVLISSINRFKPIVQAVKNHKILPSLDSRSWTSFTFIDNHIHITHYKKPNVLNVGLSVYSALQQIVRMRDDHRMYYVGGSPVPVKVCLTANDQLEDDILSLAGGNLTEIRNSKGKACQYVQSQIESQDTSAALNRVLHATEEMMRRLEIVEFKLDTAGQSSIAPTGSASRVMEAHRYSKASISPNIVDYASTSFDIAHPNWTTEQYETDLSMAVGGSGVVDGKVIDPPDPEARALVPRITTDERLNFLIRLHTALYKILEDNDEYPGSNFLSKLKQLRENELSFDHPSLDLLEIVLEDTIDWRAYVVKRNSFRLPGLHPGLRLTERVVGNCLMSLRHDYQNRWNSLVSDCVLPGSLFSKSLRWSDDRRNTSPSRARKRSHEISSRRRESDRRSGHKSRSVI